MNILYVVHQFFPNNYSGTERLVLNLSKQMQRMGHSVKVLTYAINESDGFRLVGDFLIKEYTFQGVPVISFRHKNVPHNDGFTIFDQGVEGFLDGVFLNEHYDVVHICHPMRAGSILKVAKKRNIPIVLTLTDFWLMCPKCIAVTQKGELCIGPEGGEKCAFECYRNLGDETLVRRFNQAYEYMNSVDCAVYATNFLRHLFEINNLSGNNKLIRFGKDYSNVRPNSKIYDENSEITFGYLSSVLHHKGAHILLKAFSEANMSNIKIKIHGIYYADSDYYNNLDKIISSNDKIEFCGPYKYEEMPQILDEIDVLVVPSIWWENSPLVLLRALAHSVPVIVSDLGGMTEVIIDGESGFTFEAGNSESLAKIIQKIGENPSILNEMKTKIKHPPRIEEEAFEYEKIFLSLIK